MNDNSLLSVCNLSMDIKLLIFQYLDNKSLAQLAQTCRYFGKESNPSFQDSVIKLFIFYISTFLIS